MILFPNCKINLGLSVLSKRDDGFHDIETVFYPVPFCDILEVLPSSDEKTLFRQTGLDLHGKPDDNLCMRAYRLMKEQFGIRDVEMMLHKMIPPGSGLGGGSSDAAAVLLALDRIFRLELSGDDLMGFAGRIGSDCAFFLKNKPQVASGRGEILRDAGLRLDHDIILVIPPVHISTAWAYSAIRPERKKGNVSDVIKRPVGEWKEYLVNDFEVPVFKKHPELRDIKARLYKLGAEYASMSGSGSSLFGLFGKLPDLRFEDIFPGCTVWKGKSGSC